MFCPSCGAKNEDGDKYCSGCGAQLSEYSRNDGDTPTAEGKPDPASAENPGGHPAGPKGTEEEKLKGATGRNSKSRAFRSTRPIILGGVAAVIAIAAIVATLFTNSKPGEKELRQALQDSSLLTIKESDYNNESQLNIDSVKITSCEKVTGSSAAAARMLYDTDQVYDVKGEVKLSNEAAEVSENITCSFLKGDSEWDAISTPDVESAAWSPKQGPSEDKMAENISEIVEEALSGNGYAIAYDGSTPAKAQADAKAYTGADVSFSDAKLNDDGTATVSITAKKENDYLVCGGSVTANFEFDKGRWTLESAEADDRLKEIDFSNIVGKWSGPCDSTFGLGCTAAENEAVTINITSFDATTGNLEGTITSMVHFHKNDEDNTGAETTVNNEPFTMELTAYGSHLSGEATIKLDAGVIWLSLSFLPGKGVLSDEASTGASVISGPYGSVSYYNGDTYSLRKAA